MRKILVLVIVLLGGILTGCFNDSEGSHGDGDIMEIKHVQLDKYSSPRTNTICMDFYDESSGILTIIKPFIEVKNSSKEVEIRCQYEMIHSETGKTLDKYDMFFEYELTSNDYIIVSYRESRLDEKPETTYSYSYDYCRYSYVSCYWETLSIDYSSENDNNHFIELSHGAYELNSFGYTSTKYIFTEDVLSGFY